MRRAGTGCVSCSAVEAHRRRFVKRESVEDRDSDDRQTVLELANRYGFGVEAVAVLLDAVRAGQGRMAQFGHREFGGSGQWMRGGMTMVSNLSDASLKERVRTLCEEIARRSDSLTATAPPPATEANVVGDGPDWWPAALGRPNSAGSQNGMRYAYFAAPHRLAIDEGAGIKLYDTLDHRIGGIAQQQSRGSSLRFTSQHGDVDVAHLPLLEAERKNTTAEARTSAALATLEQLAELHAKGILTDAEFAAKKGDLLSRI